jgi:arylsulfatase A-like enzyme
LIISGPNIERNKSIDTDVYVQDIMPTVLELAGISKPEFVDFHSLIPLSKGEPGNLTSVYGAYTLRQRMIRSDGFKLIAYPRASKLRLYDIKNDPLEMNDLTDDPMFKGTKDKLWEKLLALQKSMNDPLDLESFY